MYFEDEDVCICMHNTSFQLFSPDEEGICESRHFTQSGLVHLVEKTAQFMEKAQMYESMLQLYKVILRYCC